jgi:hypothetical protein
MCHAANSNGLLLYQTTARLGNPNRRVFIQTGNMCLHSDQLVCIQTCYACAAQLTAVDRQGRSPLRLLLQFAFPASKRGPNVSVFRTQLQEAKAEAPQDHCIAKCQLV